MESPLVGKTLRDADFREHYQAAVVAIHRAGQRVNEKLGALELRPGDTLVLLTDRGFGERWRNRDDFLLVTELGAPPPAVVRRGWVAVLVTLGVVVVAGAGFMPILQAALVGAGLMVVTGVLTPAEARQSVDLDVILMIAGSIGIGKAIEVSGLADLLAAQMIAISLGGGAIVLLSMIVFATVVITELISNNSAAALMYPIAVASATQLGVDPRGFAIAVAVSASLAFLTPIGYQTNMMVYGPGGYRFGDYARLGLPLTILMMIMIVLVIPLRWPF